MNEDAAFLPELFTVAHARSLECLTDDEFWDYAFEIAHRSRRSSRSSTAHTEKYLLCEGGVGRCLLPLVSLHEVIAPPTHYTKLPAAPPWMSGIIAWHGEIVVVVDLAAYLFGTTSSTHTMMVITQHNTINVALCVTAIETTITLEANSRDGGGRAEGMGPLWSSVGANKERDATTDDHKDTIPTVQGRYMEALVLDTGTLVTEIIQQIGMFSPHA